MYGQTIVGANGVGCGQGGGQYTPAYPYAPGNFSIIGADPPPPGLVDKAKAFLQEQNSVLGMKNGTILSVAAGLGLAFVVAKKNRWIR